MQNIIPLVSRASQSFQRSVQKVTDECQSTVSGLTLFSTFSLKQTDNIMMNEVVQEYKQLLDNRPCYRNQGIAQQTYQAVADGLEKLCHLLEDNASQFIVHKGHTQNSGNKENALEKTRLYASPKRASTL